MGDAVTEVLNKVTAVSREDANLVKCIAAAGCLGSDGAGKFQKRVKMMVICERIVESCSARGDCELYETLFELVVEMPLYTLSIIRLTRAVSGTFTHRLMIYSAYSTRAEAAKTET